MRPNPRAGGGGLLRPRRDDPRRPNLGMPQGGGRQNQPVYGDPMNGVGPIGGGMGGGRTPSRGQSSGWGPPSGNWQDRGFESKAAAQSVQRQYGLVDNGSGGFMKPDMDFFTRQMEANGWGPQAQRSATNEAGTPVGIGGARWMVGKNGVDFTGQQSDVPFGGQPVGQPYDSMQQTPYGRAGRTRRTRTFGQVM